MLQAYLAGVGQLKLREVPVPVPGPGEVTVRVRVSLSCGTDLKTLRRGHARLPVPGLFGHEATGEVLAVGPGVDRLAPGDAVMWVPTAPCGVCPACRAGLENHCETLFDELALGAHAEVIRLPARVVRQHVFPKPPHLEDELAALLEPLACVLRGQRRLGLAKRMLVVGVGAIGLLHVAVAKRFGVREVWAVGNRRSGVRLAEELGADRVVAGRIGDGAGALGHGGGVDGFDAVVECTGAVEVWERAPHWVRPGGRVLLFGGLAKGSRPAFDAARLHYDEVSLLGSFHYTPADVSDAYRLLTESPRAWLEPLRGLITERRPLVEIVEAFTAMQQPGYDGIKTAFYPHGVVKR